MIGLVWWPANLAYEAFESARKVEHCLIDELERIAPEVDLVDQGILRDDLYPLLEPATQPASVEAFGAMLERADVRQRLAGLGLDFLIAVAAQTRDDEGQGLILCGYTGCLGFAWQDQSTRIQAVLWQLDGQELLQKPEVETHGTSVYPTFLLPVPLLARTRVAACRELAVRLASGIRDGLAVAPAGDEKR